MWTVLQNEESVVESVSCLRVQRDTLWVDDEEGSNNGGGRRKNLRVQMTDRICVWGGFMCTCWDNDQFSVHTCCSRSSFVSNGS